MNEWEKEKIFGEPPASFEDRVRNTLDGLEVCSEMEKTKKRNVRRTLLSTAAAAVAVLGLSVGVMAASGMLNSAQLAREIGESRLADAFEAVETAAQRTVVGGYEITFEGVVSGENLSEREIHINGEQHADRSYAVFAVNGPNGEPLDIATPGVALSELGLSITPLVYGHAPWQVNIYTLHGSYEGVALDGTAYFLFSMDTLEQFAGETVIFAAYDSVYPPSAETFSMAEDGTITLNDGVDGAIFTLD